MREIVLDTETTGLNPEAGDRIVEIGCVELQNLLPTGREFQQYINPEREVPESAVKIHGLTNEFLAKYPTFTDIAKEFLEFIGDAPIIMHNAEFDRRFIFAELKLHKLPLLTNQIVDSLELARKKLSLGSYSLDSLCRYYKIDNLERSKHGALLDAKLLAEVYLEIFGGRQSKLAIEEQASERETAIGMLKNKADQIDKSLTETIQQRSLAPLLLERESQQHQLMISKLGEKAIWNNYSKRELH